MVGLAITKGGQLKIIVWNLNEEVVQLTFKMTWVNVASVKIFVRHFAEKEAKVGKQQKKKGVGKALFANVAAIQMENVPDNV